MNTEYLFQYNVPAENNYIGLPDEFINVVAKKLELREGFSVLIHPVIMGNYELRKVKNWDKALDEMEAIARKHFEEGLKIENELVDMVIQNTLQ